MKRRGIVYFHLIENNISCDNNDTNKAINAIYFNTEPSVIYSRNGDPDELGKYVISFLQSSHKKCIDGFETFLYTKHVSMRECRTISANIENIYKIDYRYHVVVDTHSNTVTDIYLDTDIKNINKLRNIFPDFYEYIRTHSNNNQ